MEYLLFFIAGLVLGAVIVYLINRFNKKDIEKTFSALSFNALRNNSQEFLKLANETLARQAQSGTGELEGKKKLIDQSLEAMKADMKQMEEMIKKFEQERSTKYGELSNQLENTAKTTNRLQETTGKLQAALASSKTRGMWGERMADDILRLAGFIENKNYIKQKTLETSSTRPDFTFYLPQELKVNMDVKFPLDNYMAFVNSESEADRQAYRTQFIRDVKQRINEVNSRDYINPEENTVDYVLVFIPNEQVYSFINECDPAVIDAAMKNKVILCSPLTLYAILAVIRQAIDNFNLEKTATEILGLLGAFNKQWDAFKNSMERMGSRIEDASKEYTKLVTTRTRALERPLARIENLRQQKGIAEASLETLPIPSDETDNIIDIETEDE